MLALAGLHHAVVGVFEALGFGGAAPVTSAAAATAPTPAPASAAGTAASPRG